MTRGKFLPLLASSNRFLLSSEPFLDSTFLAGSSEHHQYSLCFIFLITCLRCYPCFFSDFHVMFPWLLTSFSQLFLFLLWFFFFSVLSVCSATFSFSQISSNNYHFCIYPTCSLLHSHFLLVLLHQQLQVISEGFLSNTKFTA